MGRQTAHFGKTLQHSQLDVFSVSVSVSMLLLQTFINNARMGCDADICIISDINFEKCMNVFSLKLKKV